MKFHKTDTSTTNNHNIIAPFLWFITTATFTKWIAHMNISQEHHDGKHAQISKHCEF